MSNNNIINNLVIKANRALENFMKLNKDSGGTTL